MLNLTEIANFLGADSRKAKSIMSGYNYLNGRSHLYFIDDVANAIIQNSTNESKSKQTDTVTYPTKKSKKDKTEYYSQNINYL